MAGVESLPDNESFATGGSRGFEDEDDGFEEDDDFGLVADSLNPGAAADCLFLFTIVAMVVMVMTID